jgi:hypothetical protein
VNSSQCRICWQLIPRKEARRSCKDCHYSVCLGCYSDTKVVETASSHSSNRGSHCNDFDDVDSTDAPSSQMTRTSSRICFGPDTWSNSMRDLHCIQNC